MMKAAMDIFFKPRVEAMEQMTQNPVYPIDGNWSSEIQWSIAINR